MQSAALTHCQSLTSRLLEHLDLDMATHLGAAAGVRVGVISVAASLLAGLVRHPMITIMSPN